MCRYKISRFAKLQEAQEEASKNPVVDLLVVYHVLTVWRRNIYYIYLVNFSSRAYILAVMI
jgi:hypothetical protein